MKELTHKEKIRLAGIRKHGSEEAWREFQRQSSNISSRNRIGTGGFASMDKEKLKEISKRGAKKSVETRQQAAKQNGAQGQDAHQEGDESDSQA